MSPHVSSIWHRRTSFPIHTLLALAVIASLFVAVDASTAASNALLPPQLHRTRRSNVPATVVMPEMATAAIIQLDHGQKHAILHDVDGVGSANSHGTTSTDSAGQHDSHDTANTNHPGHSTDTSAGQHGSGDAAAHPSQPHAAAGSEGGHENPHENANTHQPWRLFHNHDEEEAMLTGGSGDHKATASGHIGAIDEEQSPHGEVLHLDSDAGWFVYAAIATGALNLLSCFYILVRTWPHARSTSTTAAGEEDEDTAPTATAAHQPEMTSVSNVDCEAAESAWASASPIHATPVLDGRSTAMPVTAPISSAARQRMMGHHRRTSTRQIAAETVQRIRTAASHGPWRWSAAAWDLQAYAASSYSNSSTSLSTIATADSAATVAEASNDEERRRSQRSATIAALTSGTPKPTSPLATASPRTAGDDDAADDATIVAKHTVPARSASSTQAAQERRHNHVAARHRFAFYTTTTDLAITAIVTGSALFTSVHGHLPNGGWCRALGMLSYTLIAMDLALVAFEAVLFWTVVSHLTVTMSGVHSASNEHQSVREIDCGSAASLGRYHWKLWLACAVAPWLIAFTLLPFHGFGWDRYWCFVYNYSAGGKSALAFMVMLHYTVLLIVSLCYIPVLRAAKQIPVPADRQVAVAEQLDKQHQKRAEERASAQHKRVVDAAGITLTHLLLQVIHYTPGTLHVAAQFFDYEDLWIYMVAVMFTQSGALMHAVVIAWSEWKDDQRYNLQQRQQHRLHQHRS